MGEDASGEDNANGASVLGAFAFGGSPKVMGLMVAQVGFLRPHRFGYTWLAAAGHGVAGGLCRGLPVWGSRHAWGDRGPFPVQWSRGRARCARNARAVQAPTPKTMPLSPPPPLFPMWASRLWVPCAISTYSICVFHGGTRGRGEPEPVAHAHARPRPPTAHLPTFGATAVRSPSNASHPRLAPPSASSSSTTPVPLDGGGEVRVPGRSPDASVKVP